MSELTLYTYFRSSAAYRVRIALALKGIDHTSSFVHLVKEGGQHTAAEYKAVNFQGLVPSLDVDDQSLTQSMAILEYIEEVYPEPPLLPQDAFSRAQVRSLAQIIVADIHPLNNLRVIKYLESELAINKADRAKWYQHWIKEGFSAIEKKLHENGNGSYCFGSNITMADLCLIPQVYNALRFSVSLVAFPNIDRVYRNCIEQDAFIIAAPERQEDCDV